MVGQCTTPCKLLQRRRIHFDKLTSISIDGGMAILQTVRGLQLKSLTVDHLYFGTVSLCGDVIIQLAVASQGVELG